MTAASAYRRETCRLCGGRDYELALKLAATPPADAYVPRERGHEIQETYPLDLRLCRSCGHVQLFDVVQPETIYIDYIYETKTSLGLAEHFHQYADDVVNRFVFSPGGFVVDIGSNDGTLLRWFQQRGLQVLGIDPAREIARRATAEGIETLPVFFTAELGRELRRERGSAAVITSNNLVANVDHLEEMVEGIRALLAPDGVFVFESFYLVDWIQQMVFDFMYHEHLSYFSVRPLQTFFKRHGMELIDATRVPTKGGSLRYAIQLAGGPHRPSQSVEELIALEMSLGLDRVAPFRDFATRIDQAKHQVQEVLRPLKAQGKMIDGYGASATTTTLLYHFELGDLIGAIYDDNPQRHHLLSPGLHLPVLPPAMLRERNPDMVVILAWRYVEPILQQHQAYLAAGGRALVPLPALRVIHGRGRNSAVAVSH